MQRTAVDLLQGSLDVIVLKTLSWQPMHGFGIARWIQRVTDDVLQVEEGSLYPCLTAAGRKQLAQAATTWGTFAEAMAKIMRATAQPA
jgi:PadR family transcriptional regulator PadR